MIKRLFLFTFIFSLAFANNAWAHTGLESSFPKNGDIIKQELQQITLTFESKIEQTSTFELQHSNGDLIPVKDISLTENQMIGSFSNPLENGEYQVNWKIIGADGHPIEGVLSFSVDLPVTETPTEKQEEPQSQPNVEEKKADIANETQDEEIEQNKLSTFVIPTIIVALIVIVIASFLWIMRRKK